MDDSDSYDNVVDWLGKHDIADDDPSTACAKLLENILLDIINGSSMPQIAKESEIDLELIDEIQQKIKLLPRPANVPVPAVATEDEQKYIAKLSKGANITTDVLLKICVAMNCTLEDIMETVKE